MSFAAPTSKDKGKGKDKGKKATSSEEDQSDDEQQEPSSPNSEHSSDAQRRPGRKRSEKQLHPYKTELKVRKLQSLRCVLFRSAIPTRVTLPPVLTGMRMALARLLRSQPKESSCSQVQGTHLPSTLIGPLGPPGPPDLCSPGPSSPFPVFRSPEFSLHD